MEYNEDAIMYYTFVFKKAASFVCVSNRDSYILMWA